MQGFQRLPLATIASDTTDLTEIGLMGAAGAVTSAKDASAEVGKEFIKPYIEDLVRFVNEFKKVDISTLLPKSHK